jgi:HEAT repeat protein
MDAAGLIRIISDPGASEFRKAKACQRAGELGAKEAVPALAKLLSDERMAMYARYGLEPIADPSVDDALRDAMAKLSGNLRIGVINSIGKRRDAKAGPALVKLMLGDDVETARAAAAALGAIGNSDSARELLAAMAKTRGALRLAVGDAALVCAERMIASGMREQGLALYASLSGTDVPKAVRLGAMAAVIREETSVGRPR